MVIVFVVMCISHHGFCFICWRPMSSSHAAHCHFVCFLFLLLLFFTFISIVCVCFHPKWSLPSRYSFIIITFHFRCFFTFIYIDQILFQSQSWTCNTATFPTRSQFLSAWELNTFKFYLNQIWLWVANIEKENIISKQNRTGPRQGSTAGIRTSNL